MIRIELTESEAKLLHAVCLDYLSDLRMEISGTDSADFRENLKKEEASLKSLIERLSAVPAGA